MREILPNLRIVPAASFEDVIEDAANATIGIELESYPVFDSSAEIRVIARNSVTSEKCAEFDAIEGEGEMLVINYVAFSELGVQLYSALFLMPTVEC